MHALIVILSVTLLQSNTISCQSEYEAGNIYPIPLVVSNGDSISEPCSDKNGAYAHSSNCSLFRMCTSGMYTVYSCIDGFFFNPTSRRCQYLPIEKEARCDTILEIMQHSLVEFVTVSNSHHRRKSATSKCTQTGIYPDMLDCSLFHYCRENKQHEIIKCPNGLNFDPKTFLCSTPQIVNCQYEPASRLEDETNNLTSNTYSGVLLDAVCRDYAPGSYLPMPNHFDKFLICGDGSGSIVMKCKPGLTYNALTTACEKGPCTFDSTLCDNEGQCVDESNMEKGFKCVCSNQYEGEFCQNEITTEKMNIKPMIDRSSADLLRGDGLDLKTAMSYIEYGQGFFSNSDQQQPLEQLLRMGLVFAASLIGIILLGAVFFALIKLTRLIFYGSTGIAGRWDILREESSV